MDLSGLIKKHEKEFIALRREFHSIPELGFKEFETTDRIVQYLKEWDIEVTTFDELTGAVGLLGNNSNFETICIRADIDALPIKEETGLEYASKNQGNMHACGHDGHIAIALGTAKILSILKDKLRVNVKFLFQPSEEAPGGAESMIENHVLKDVDSIIGLHIFPTLASGVFGIKEGHLMAATDVFDISIKGKGGHGAIPHKAVDSILTATEIITSFQKIISRELDPLSSAVISVGTIHAGSAANIIPEDLTMSGTVRTFDVDVRNYIKNRMEEIVSSITKTNKATYVLNHTYGVPAVTNDINLTRKIKNILEKSLGEDSLVETDPTMSSEDFALYQEQIPGTFMFLGSQNKDKKIVNLLHHSQYSIDENVLAIGVRGFCEIILNY